MDNWDTLRKYSQKTKKSVADFVTNYSQHKQKI